MRNELEEELGWEVVLASNNRIGKFLDFTPEIEYSVGSKELGSYVFTPKNCVEWSMSSGEQKAECEKWIKNQREKYPESEFSHPSYEALRQEWYPQFHRDWNALHAALTKLKKLGKNIPITDIGTTWKIVSGNCQIIHAEIENDLSIAEKGHKFVPPYRVGRNQRRAILDSLGHEVGIFSTGQEAEATKYCDYLNNGGKPSELTFKDGEVEFCEVGFDFDLFKKQFDKSFSNVSPIDFVAKMIKLGYKFESTESLTIKDYIESAKSNNKLVRELDVILNGEEGAAKQASLCDIVSQVQSDYRFHPEKWAEFIDWLSKDEEGWRFDSEDKLWKKDGWRSRTMEQLFKYFHKQK